jgi:hypothetical protein
MCNLPRRKATAQYTRGIQDNRLKCAISDPQVLRFSRFSSRPVHESKLNSAFGRHFFSEMSLSQMRNMGKSEPALVMQPCAPWTCLSA